MQVQRPGATAPATYQLLLPLELPESLEPRAWLPSISSAPTVLPHQVWGTLPLTEQRRAQRVFVQVIGGGVE